MKRILAFLLCACVLLCSCGNTTKQAPGSYDASAGHSEEQAPGSYDASAGHSEEQAPDSYDASAGYSEGGPIVSTLPYDFDPGNPIEDWLVNEELDVERLFSDYGWNAGYSYDVGINYENDAWYRVEPSDIDNIRIGQMIPDITLRCDPNDGPSFSISWVRGLGNFTSLDVHCNKNARLEVKKTKNGDYVPRDLMRLLSAAMYWVNTAQEDDEVVDRFVELSDDAALEGIEIRFVTDDGRSIAVSDEEFAAYYSGNG